MKALLITTAIGEIATGIALLAIPALVASNLHAAALDAPVGLTLARVAGMALLALGVVCWMARDDAQILWQNSAQTSKGQTPTRFSILKS